MIDAIFDEFFERDVPLRNLSNLATRRARRRRARRHNSPRRACPRWFEAASLAAPAPRTRSGTPPRWFSWASSPARRDSSTRAAGAFCASTWWCTASTGTWPRAPSAGRRRRRRARATAGNSRRGATRFSSPSTPRASRYVTDERLRRRSRAARRTSRCQPERSVGAVRLFSFFERRRRAQKVATLAATNAAYPPLRLTH